MSSLFISEIQASSLPGRAPHAMNCVKVVPSVSTEIDQLTGAHVLPVVDAACRSEKFILLDCMFSIINIWISFGLYKRQSANPRSGAR